MTEVAGEVTVKLKGLKRFGDAVETGLRNGSAEVGAAVKKWAFRYRSFLMDRFDKYSKGGGDWPPLKYREGSILRDTGTLFAALAPVFVGAPGALQQMLKDGIRVGFGGNASHPSGDATVAKIAEYHQTGAGHLPVRKIVVQPPLTVVKHMGNDMQIAINKVANRTKLR